MDIRLVMFSFYKDEAIEAKKTLESVVMGFVISFVTVFIPLSYAFPNYTQIFQNILLVIPLVIIPAMVFYLLKYREHRYKYMTTITKYLTEEIIKNKNSANPDTEFLYGDISKEIHEVTLFEEEDILKILHALYIIKE